MCELYPACFAIGGLGACTQKIFPFLICSSSVKITKLQSSRCMGGYNHLSTSLDQSLLSETSSLITKHAQSILSYGPKCVPSVFKRARAWNHYIKWTDNLADNNLPDSYPDNWPGNQDNLIIRTLATGPIWDIHDTAIAELAIGFTVSIYSYFNCIWLAEFSFANLNLISWYLIYYVYSYCQKFNGNSSIIPAFNSFKILLASNYSINYGGMLASLQALHIANLELITYLVFLTIMHSKIMDVKLSIYS